MMTRSPRTILSLSHVFLYGVLLSGLLSSCEWLEQQQIFPPIQGTDRASPSVSSTVSPPEGAEGEFAALEQSIFEQINQYRLEKGLSPLALNPAISQQAREHSKMMSTSQSLSHDGFEQRVDIIAQSISYQTAAENVAYNQGFANPDEQAVIGWINSPEHRQNIEGAFDLTGVGIARNLQGEYYFTQIFILSR